MYILGQTDTITLNIFADAETFVTLSTITDSVEIQLALVLVLYYFCSLHQMFLRLLAQENFLLLHSDPLLDHIICLVFIIYTHLLIPYKMRVIHISSYSGLYSSWVYQISSCF
jgi:hypothetical protein